MTFPIGSTATHDGVDALGLSDGVALPGGGVVLAGIDRSHGIVLAQLHADGSLDPAFGTGGIAHLGAPSFVAQFLQVLRRPDGRLLIVAALPPASRYELARIVVVGLSAGGDLDPAFGTAGLVSLIRAGNGPAELLRAPDGGDIVAGPESIGNAAQTPRLIAARVSPAGIVASVANVAIPFGGGQASVFAVHRAPLVTSLRQTGFFPGRALARADGSLVLPGATAVVQYTGEGAGYEIDQAAVAAVTPAFVLDPSFGGPARPATVSVHVARQRATSATDVRLLRVAVSVRTSGPGLCRLRVKVGRRVIAHSTAPVFAAGPQRLRALLTTVGRRYLRHAHRVPVTVTATFRDLVGAQATARATGTLR